MFRGREWALGGLPLRLRLAPSRRPALLKPPDSCVTAAPSLRIPAVGALLETPRFRALAERNGRSLVTAALRLEVREVRRGLRAGAAPAGFGADPEGWLAGCVETRLTAWEGPRLRRVVNATGVVVHTNLGRAPLADRAAVAVFRAASGYADLEFDLAAGGRGSRQDHLTGLLQAMFGAPAALVVNNAAGAVLLALDSLAAGKEVVVSRGELVEIGGSFRVPEILEKSGARLREVGTTNRTRASDYRRALEAGDGRVGALLRVHQSNFRIVGFTEAARTVELVALGKEFGVPVIEDFGSGNLLPLADYGVREGQGEPTVPERVAAGADLLIFSGDKLLGGPQAGILLGSETAVAACRQNPLARALRLDKTAVAGLQATLFLHSTGRAADEIPIVRSIVRPLAAIEAAAHRLREELLPSAAPGWEIRIRSGLSRIGGGAAPGAELPTCCLALSHPDRSPDGMRARLLAGDPPVVPRIAEGEVRFDLRTVPEGEAPELAEALRCLVAS